MRSQYRHITRPVTQVHMASDRDRNEDWWSLRDDTPVFDAGASDDRLNCQVHELLSTTAIFADVVDTMPACPVGQREPDSYEDGMAIWIGTECVVLVEIEHLDRVLEVAMTAKRSRWFDEANRYGFVRVSPEHYGVRVETFEGDNPSAYDAWRHLVSTVSA